jgi:hypothetical protein
MLVMTVVFGMFGYNSCFWNVGYDICFWNVGYEFFFGMLVMAVVFEMLATNIPKITLSCYNQHSNNN